MRLRIASAIAQQPALAKTRYFHVSLAVSFPLEPIIRSSRLRRPEALNSPASRHSAPVL